MRQNQEISQFTSKVTNAYKCHKSCIVWTRRLTCFFTWTKLDDLQRLGVLAARSNVGDLLRPIDNSQCFKLQEYWCNLKLLNDTPLKRTIMILIYTNDASCYWYIHAYLYSRYMIVFQERWFKSTKKTPLGHLENTLCVCSLPFRKMLLHQRFQLPWLRRFHSFACERPPTMPERGHRKTSLPRWDNERKLLSVDDLRKKPQKCFRHSASIEGFSQSVFNGPCLTSWMFQRV